MKGQTTNCKHCGQPFVKKKDKHYFCKTSHRVTYHQRQKGKSLKPFKTSIGEVVSIPQATKTRIVKPVKDFSQDKTFVLMDTIEEAFGSMIASLNTDIGGVHIFSGGRTDVKPVVGNDLSDLVAAGAASDMFQNDQRKAVAKIGKNTNMEYSLLADEVAEGIFAAIKNIADFDNLTPISGELTPAQNAFLESQLVVLDAAIDDLRIINSSNGMRYSRANELLEEHENRETFMLNFISDIEDVNMAEAITRVNNDQIALDVSYKLTSELAGMSLLNFV